MADLEAMVDTARATEVATEVAMARDTDLAMVVMEDIKLCVIMAVVLCSFTK